MRNATRIGLAATTALTVSALSACAPSAAPDADDTSKAPRYVMIVNSQWDPFYVTLAEGAATEAEELGIEFDWQAPSEVTIAAQTALLQSVAASKPDGIIFGTVDKVAMAAPLRAVVDQGIPVITVDNDVDDPSARLFTIKSDGRDSGKLAAEFANDVLAGDGSVAYLGYTPGIDSIDARLAGWEEGVAEHPGLESLTTEYAGLDISENQLKATGMLSRFPDLDLIYTPWGGACSGVIQAVKQAGRTGEVLVVCADTQQERISEVLSGDIAALTLQDPRTMGSESVRLMRAYIENGENPGEVVLDQYLATSENVEDLDIIDLFYVDVKEPEK